MKYVVDKLFNTIITSIENKTKNKKSLFFSFIRINAEEKKTAIDIIAR
tara:strand:- start:391 stop:534 length:144 start_codon:yes stop_codon:yes gene_type:complete